MSTRRLCSCFRQTLDADSVYVDVALHASGLTSLQFRDEKGAVTREDRNRNLSAPKRLRIAKRGDYVYMSLWRLTVAIPSPRADGFAFRCRATFYVGLGVCSHDKDVVETGSLLQRRTDATSPAERRQAGSLQHARNRRHRFRRPPRRLSRSRTLRSSELDA